MKMDVTNCSGEEGDEMIDANADSNNSFSQLVTS